MNAMTAAYAVVVAISAAMCISLLLAEPERETPRHRLPRSEIAAMFREILYTVGLVAGSVIIISAISLGLIIEGLHRLDAHLERKFWHGEAVHS
jgi:hypothetical protein